MISFLILYLDRERKSMNFLFKGEQTMERVGLGSGI
jgi:hypothetical protein